MDYKAKKFWLCNYLERKLKDIKTDPALFPRTEKHYIMALGKLYKLSFEHGSYYVEKYRSTINKKLREKRNSAW